MNNLLGATLTVLAMAASGTVMADEIETRAEFRSEEAASIVSDLIQAGHIAVEPESGRLILVTSTLDVLKAIGVAKELEHAARSSECGETTGSDCS